MFDCHVRNGQAALNAQRANDGACIFNDMAGPARRAQHAGNMQNNVLCRDARAKFALNADFHRLGLAELQPLGGQYMLDL